VLLPCLFIAALGVEWLRLERDAAARRGEDAARAAVATLSDALTTRLAAIAASTEAVILTPSLDPLEATRLQAPLSDAFLFDAGNRLIAPAVLVADAAGSARPQSLEAVRRAAAALAARDWPSADRQATSVFASALGERDEFGVALVSYAAWQRAEAYRREAAASPRMRELVGDLRRVVEAGYLGTSTDLTQLRLLAEKTADPAMTEVIAAAERAGRLVSSRQGRARLASLWLSATAASGLDGGRAIGPLRRGDAAVAVLDVRPDGRRLVMIAEPQSLGEWIAAQSELDPSFTFRLDTRHASVEGAYSLAILRDVPDLLVAVQPRAAESPLDRDRGRLFIAAAGGALALTLVVGYLALRDVSRELRLASLRAAFIAGVTHELKTPLTSIRLLAETLRHDRVKPEARDQVLDTVINETERLSEVVDNVLSTSRIESGTRVYDAKPIDIEAAVRGVLRRFDYVLAKEGFRLEAAMQGDATTVVVDAEGFAQALMNLLSNALKYSGTSREIRVSVTRAGDEVAVAVADRGVGIAENEQKRIFQSFYRVPETSQQTAGAGLGLALVRHFAEAHRGRVTVSSQPGAGSVFTLWLPIAGTAVSATAAVPAHG
jgi:two-component system phosphate regulon sensor histidine kinase PhoR